MNWVFKCKFGSSNTDHIGLSIIHAGLLITNVFDIDLFYHNKFIGH